MEIRLHKKQGEAFLSKATEILYGGAAGGGKSHLMRALAVVYCQQIPNLQVYLFRRVSDDLVKNHMEGSEGFVARLSQWSDDNHVTITSQPARIRFWNGAAIHLCHCQYEKDVIKYQGAEIHLLLIDELTHFTEYQYRFLRARCRAPESIKCPEQFQLPKIFCSSNPGSIGHAWVKRAFIDPAPAGQIVRKSEEEGGMLRQFIPARLSDNPSIDQKEYASRLRGLGASWLIEAMLNGNWNITAGGFITDIWEPEIHIMEPFTIPHTWRIDRSFDWGSSHPYAVCWWAESDGSDYQLKNGEWRSTLPGDLFMIDELYGGKNNVGFKESTEVTCQKIKKIEEHIGREVDPGAADTQIFSNNAGKSIYSDYAENGIEWKRANKYPGSRVNGAKLFRERLQGALDRDGTPGLFFFSHCREAIRTLPELIWDEKNLEDVNTKGDDHCLSGETIIHTIEYGSIKIKDAVGKDGHILTSGGYYSKFSCCKMTKKNAEVVEVKTNEGYIVCTPEHLILNSGLIFKEAESWKYSKLQKSNKVLMVKRIGSAENITKDTVKDCIDTFGNFITGKFMVSSAFTTLTEINQITILKILLLLNLTRNTSNIIKKSIQKLQCQKNALKKQRSGTPANKEENGIKNISKIIKKNSIKRLIQYVKTAEKKSCKHVAELFIALCPVAQLIEENRGLTISQKNALSAVKSLLEIAITKYNPAPGYVLKSCEVQSINKVNNEDVYCLNVEGTNCFVVNDGFVVHNCYDSIIYRLATSTGGVITTASIRNAG